MNRYYHMEPLDIFRYLATWMPSYKPNWHSPNSSKVEKAPSNWGITIVKKMW